MGRFKPTALGAGAILLIAGLVLVSDASSKPPTEAAHDCFLAGAIALGTAAGFIAAALGLLDAAGLAAKISPRSFYSMGGCVGLAIALFIRCFGMHQIGGFDHSVVVDLGWRLVNGQIPYVDFPCTVPVGFLIGAKFAFQWFGVTWSSIIDFTALFALTTFMWSLFLFEQLFGRRWLTLLWALTFQAMTLMLLCFWWYNPVTSVASEIYVLSAAVWLHRPKAWSAMVSYGLAMLLLAAMKPNVAGILVPLVAVVLFSSSLHRWKTLLVSATAFALFLLLLWSNHLSLTGMFKGYLSVASRVGSFKGIYEFVSALTIWLSIAALVLVLVPIVVALCLGWRAIRSRGSWIALVTLAGGLYSFLTNGELKLVDLSTVLLACFLLVGELRGTVVAADCIFRLPLGWNRALSLICVILASAGTAQGIVRDRVKGIGLMIFFEYDGAKHVMPDGFFKGVECGDIFFEVNRELTEVLRQTGSASVWFGPRMQWAYAAFDKPSPRGQPVWWHPGVSFAQSDEQLYFQHLLDSKTDVLILFKNDVSYYPKEMVQQLVAGYEVNQSAPLLTILLRKK